MTYPNRSAAGDTLADHLREYRGRDDAVVLGLVRGGVPVAQRVAERLGLPLDILVVRKLGVPWSPELAFGAIGPGGVVVHNPEVEDHLAERDVTEVIDAEAGELGRREARYRAGRGPLNLTGRIAIVVDDGLATGATARAAVQVARRLGARRVVLAVPVAAADSLQLVRQEADEVVCPLAPSLFGAVSSFYASFPQTSDAEVAAALSGHGQAA